MSLIEDPRAGGIRGAGPTREGKSTVNAAHVVQGMGSGKWSSKSKTSRKGGRSHGNGSTFRTSPNIGEKEPGENDRMIDGDTGGEVVLRRRLHESIGGSLNHVEWGRESLPFAVVTSRF